MRSSRPTDRSAPPLDLDVLLERCAGSASIAGKVLDLFERQAAHDLEAISGALNAADAQETARRAHALKGAAGAVSAAELSAAAARLESSARAGDLSAAVATLSALQEEIERCLARLPAVREELKKAG